jgi:hypothetical protein
MVTEETCRSDELDPHPEIPPNPTAIPAANTISDIRSSHLRRFPTPARSQPASPTPANEIAMPPPVPDGSRRLAACVVEKLTAVVAAAPFGVTVLGLKLQKYPDGSPAHAKETAELKPLLGVTVRVVAAAADPLAVPLVGAKEIAKSGGGGAATVIVIAAEVDAA